MKTILAILVMLSISTQAQKATFTFYTGSSESFGAEIMFTEKAGAGFAGTNEATRGLGEFKPGDISEWDLKNKINTVTQKWFTMYGLVSFGYLKGIKVSYLLGGALYGRKMNFEYNGTQYHKDDSVFIKPIVGIDFSKEITKDVGVKLGFDSFNYIKLGINVYF
jgi:hypothetical protein